MKLHVGEPEEAAGRPEQPPRPRGKRWRWPEYVFGGRVRTSTLVLIVAFIAVWWVYDTYHEEPKPPVAPQVVPPGFVPDPAYTWVPRTRVRQPSATVPETTTPTPTTTETPTSTEPPTSELPTPTPEPGFPFCPPLCPPPPPSPSEEPGATPSPSGSPESSTSSAPSTGERQPPGSPGPSSPASPTPPVTSHPAAP